MVNKKGIALVVALIVMVVVGILVTGALFTSLTSLTVAGNDRGATMAQYIAQAGMTRTLTQANQSSRFLHTHWTDYAELINDNTVRIEVECSNGDFASFGIDFDRIRDLKDANGNTVNLPNGYPSRSLDLIPDEVKVFPFTLPDGTEGGYDVLMDPNGISSIRVRGWVGGNSYDTARSRATNVVSLRAGGSGAYDNAIFVRGFSGPAINGNLGVYGSVHSVQDNLNPDDAGLSLGGNAGAYNDYLGTGANNTPTNITENVDGLGGDSSQDQLCTRIKLKTGRVEFESGATQLGRTDNKIVGVYVEENASIVRKNGRPVNSSQLHVETPTTGDPWNLYDESAGFPELDSGYPTEVSSYTVPNDQNLLTSDCQKLMEDVDGDGSYDRFVIPPPADASLAAPLANRYQTLTCGTAANLGNDHYIRWHAAIFDPVTNTTTPGYLEIEGVFNTNGYDFYIPPDIATDDDGDGVQDNTTWQEPLFDPDTGAPVDADGDGIQDTQTVTGPVSEKTTVYYNGIGSIRAGESSIDDTANIGINGNLKPVDVDNTGAIIKDLNDVDGDGNIDEPKPGNYIEENILGFTSSGPIDIATAPGAAQVEMAAIFYSQETVEIGKQTIILGSVIADSIDAGQNVPKIAWDRRLAEAGAIPPGMPSDDTGTGGVNDPLAAAPTGSLRLQSWEKR